MIYQIKKSKKNIKILGKEFAENNKNKGKIVYNNKNYKMNYIFLTEGIKEIDLKLKMILDKNSYSKNFIFENCRTLLHFSIYEDIFQLEDDLDKNDKIIEICPENNLNTTNLISKESSKKTLENIPLIENFMDNESKLNNCNNLVDSNYGKETINKYSIIHKNEECTKLNDINNIYNYIDNSFSKRIDNITNMSNMFYNCLSLESIPDIISFFNTKNVIDMSGIFFNCKSLKELPNISNWKTDNVINMSRMFYNCEKITSIPDISKWKIENCIDISEIFSGCSNLNTFPNISNWKTKKITNMSKIFYKCKKLSLPTKSIKLEWDTTNVTNMEYMFYNCKSLLNYPRNI